MLQVLCGVFAISAVFFSMPTQQTGQKQDSNTPVLNRSIKAAADAGNTTSQHVRARVSDEAFTGRAFQLNPQTIQARGLAQPAATPRVHTNTSTQWLERK